jgi:hypothetical protein
MRVITTGSRNWEGQWAENRINAMMRSLEILAGTIDHTNMTVVHGGCPTGADAIVDRWCRRRFYEPVVYPADWAALGKAAGPVRNTNMALAGGDVCVAFNRANSAGTVDMMEKARRQNIWVVEIRWRDEYTEDSDIVRNSSGEPILYLPTEAA